MNPFAQFALSASLEADSNPPQKQQSNELGEKPLARKRVASVDDSEKAVEHAEPLPRTELGSREHARRVIAMLKVLPELQLASVHRFQALFDELKVDRALPNPVFCCLVACILSSQTRDTTAIAVVRKIVRHFEGDVTPARVAALPLEELETLVHSCNYYRTKAKAIHGAARMVQDLHDGQVPDDWDALLRLPGVGPKIANLVLCVGHQINHGLVVDTHVRRLTQRVGIAASTSDLEDAFVSSEWNDVTVTLISFGQVICLPTHPKCSECPLAGKELCKYDIEQKRNRKSRQSVLLEALDVGDDIAEAVSDEGTKHKKPKNVEIKYEEP